MLFPQRFRWYVLQPSSDVCCLNFWDEVWWFLSLRVFGLLSSSLLLFPQRLCWYILRPYSGVFCLNFWDKAYWFLSLRVFGLLSSSLLIYSQRFDQCVLQPSSGVSNRTRGTTRNFKPRPLFNPLVLLALIPLTIIEYKC